MRQGDGDDSDDIQPDEYENLILDEMKIERLTKEDGLYLASFTSLDRLSLNQTCLKSLENFPPSKKIARLELAENQLTGAELLHLTKYAESLHTLKIASNRISSLKDLEPLKELKCLKNLDLENNEVTKVEGYKAKVWEMIPSLEVLDNFDKEGCEVLSDDEDYGEEDEQELDEEQLAILKERGIKPEDFLKGNGFFDDEDGEDDFLFEGGEDEMFEDGESEDDEVEDKSGAKRTKQ